MWETAGSRVAVHSPAALMLNIQFSAVAFGCACMCLNVQSYFIDLLFAGSKNSHQNLGKIQIPHVNAGFAILQSSY